MNLLSSSLVLGLAEGGHDSFSAAEIWRSASIANKFIIAILFVLLAYQIYVAVERFVTYAQSKQASDKFLKLFMDTLRRGDFEAAKRAATTHNKSHIALVLKHGLDIFQYEKQLKTMNPNHDAIQPVERAIQRGTAEVLELLKKGMSGLATIGALAPFIGLLGTVIGIIKVFSDLKTKGAGDINALAGSIGEALATTALGLIVAIPAVWIYNLLTNKQDVVVTNINNAASQMIDEFIRRESQS
ncbi:MotA/TolQ/ExbB proton channel family protein [Geothrix sp. 21YS21S-4]|uniref:MotA/TolQ/ExbB proton channel family protein n=1 Tax=Geothrix sp. 21YS21S-4 TaxID=3068889 RepID=UPI0027BA376B|nr:MotA/TolQ/ExbB proton channel family protein [Geothrix sp. 21YS21S-4]